MPMPASGAHEVIVNAPESVLSLAELPASRLAEAMEVWRLRMRAHSDCAYVQLIVNERREAGASLEHTHSQLYALDFVPAEVARERERCGAYATRTMGAGCSRILSPKRCAAASGSSRSTRRPC